MNKSKTFRIKHADSIRKTGKEWRLNNPHKRKAHALVFAALKSNLITRPSKCDVCLSSCKPDAHHNDYSKPLDVIWMCRSCHSKHHGVCVGIKKNYVKGESHPKAKLKLGDVQEIRRLLRIGTQKLVIASMFKVDESLVRQIAKGKIWKQI